MNHKKMLSVMMAAGMMASLLSFAAMADESETEDEDRTTISVSASEQISVAPDKASFSLEILGEGETSSEAREVCAEKSDAVTEAIRALDVAEESIQTQSYYVNPEYKKGTLSQEYEIYKYTATLTLTISDLDVDKVGDVMTAALEAEADEVYSLRYYSSEYDAKYQEALAKATETSLAKAGVLAEAAGLSVSGVQSISEGYQDDSYRYVTEDSLDYAMEASASEENTSSKAMAVTQIDPGEIDITAEVSMVVYAE